MNHLAILLILASALLHTYWNVALKRAISLGADEHLYWYGQAAALAVYAVPIIILAGRDPPGWDVVGIAAASAIFVCAYIFGLGRSYKDADLSRVYPLSRITPLFTLGIGVFYLHEAVTAAELAGIVLVLLGAFALSMERITTEDLRRSALSLATKGSLFAIGVAGVNAVYGLLSRQGIAHTNPLLFIYMVTAFTVLFYSPVVIIKKSRVLHHLRTYNKEIIKIGVCDAASYALVLAALSFDTFSDVFALRQMSIVFSVAAGVWLLGEKMSSPRAAATLLILAGVVILGIAH